MIIANCVPNANHFKVTPGFSGIAQTRCLVLLSNILKCAVSKIRSSLVMLCLLQLKLSLNALQKPRTLIPTFHFFPSFGNKKLLQEEIDEVQYCTLNTAL